MGVELTAVKGAAGQPVAVFHAPQHIWHQPGALGALGGWRASRDDPRRVDGMLAALGNAGLAAVEAPASGMAPIECVHERRYLDFLASAHARWRVIPGASQEVHANVFAMRVHGKGYPSSVVGQAAFHFHDQLAPIAARTFDAALASANLAVAAAQAIVEGNASCSYALCRPPGHHAYAGMAGGGTYLNNAAIAVEQLRTRFARVAVIDVDVHHGNGTQDIFWHRPDVLFASLHRDPGDYHPFFSGYATEVGEGPGEGFTVNRPLPEGTGDSDYLRILDAILLDIIDFAPQALVVSLGLDAHETDPAQGLRLTDAAYRTMGREVRQLGLPTVLVQEGGYNPVTVGGTLTAFLSAWL